MIQEVTLYTVICDNCGKDCNADSEYCAYNDESYANEVAMESNWIKEGDKHYCPECFDYDDYDNLIINEKRNNGNNTISNKDKSR